MNWTKKSNAAHVECRTCWMPHPSIVWIMEDGAWPHPHSVVRVYIDQGRDWTAVGQLSNLEWHFFCCCFDWGFVLAIDSSIDMIWGCKNIILGTSTTSHMSIGDDEAKKIYFFESWHSVRSIETYIHIPTNQNDASIPPDLIIQKEGPCQKISLCPQHYERM